MIKVYQRFATFTTIFLMYCCITLVRTNVHYKTLMVSFVSDECSGNHRKEIILGDGTAINFTLHYLNDHYHNRWKYLECNYRLKPFDQQSGVFAVIQKLSLHARGNECSSYIEFATGNRGKSQKFCRTLSAKDVMNRDQQGFDTQSKNNTFISSGSDGAIDINIFILKEEMINHLQINVIFTLFYYCVYTSKYHGLCLENREFCIHQKFFEDGVINCPFFGCVDEGGCIKNQSSPSILNKTPIGVMISIWLFPIIAISLSIYLIQARLNCARTSINRNNPSEAQETRVVELDVHSQTMNDNAYVNFQTMNDNVDVHSQTMNDNVDVHSQTMNDNVDVHSQTMNDNVDVHSQIMNDADKDLPPSYESLFPSR